MIQKSLVLLSMIALTTTGCGKSEDSSTAKTKPAELASNALSACKLDKPIELGTDDPRKNPLTLVKIEFDQAIQGDDLKAIVPNALDFFEIKREDSSRKPAVTGTGYLGVSLKQLDGNGTSVGLGQAFASIYALGANLTGTVEKYNGYSTFQTTEKSKVTDGSDKTPEVTQVVAVIKDKKLLSLQITVPVRKQITESSFEFAGTSQTLCLKSAEKKE